MCLNVLAADDEQAALNRLVRAIREAEPDCVIRDFTDPLEAINSIGEDGYRPDVAFLDIEMYGMTGIEMAKRMKELSPRTKVIFVTAYSGYALEAFSVHARGYLIKPASPEHVREELEDLEHHSFRPGPGIFIHTFGNFDVLVDGSPVCFRSSKSKEILAYLVDRRGASASKKEIAAVLWEDEAYTRSRQFQIQKLIAQMIQALREAGAEQIVRKKYNSYSVEPAQFVCDYYQFNRWDMEAVNAYHGEYMSNYSWAEFTIASLNERLNGRKP